MPIFNSFSAGSGRRFRSLFTFPLNPNAPTASLPATYGNTTASLSWSAPLSIGTAITDYVVQYSSDGGNSWTTFNHAPSNATSIVVTGLNNGTAYVFRVAAVNLIGTGSFSTVSNSATPLFGKLPTPTGDIAETTSTIPICYTNYDASYTYNYYDYNAAPNDTTGECQGWTGLGENVNRYTYVYVSKPGWANSDAAYFSETTNVSPPAPPAPPPCSCSPGPYPSGCAFIAYTCDGAMRYDYYDCGCSQTCPGTGGYNGQYVDGYCGYVASQGGGGTPAPPPAPPPAEPPAPPPCTPICLKGECGCI